MEKFKSLSAITNKYLNGKLSRVNLEYEDSKTLEVSIIYEYANYYELDYKMRIDLSENNVSFVSHDNEVGFNKMTLNREKEFESAVSKTFLPLPV